MLVVIPAALGAIVLARRAARYGSVVVPSPEHRAAATARVQTVPRPAKVQPKQRLRLPRQRPVGLEPDYFGGFPAWGCLPYYLVFMVLWLVMIGLVRVVAPGRAPTRMPVWLLGGLGAVLLVVFWRVVRKRLGGLSIKLSVQPPRAGGQFQLVIAQDHAIELSRLQLTLVCREQATTYGPRGGRRDQHRVASSAAIPIDPSRSPDGSVRATVHVPRDSAPSMVLEFHRIDWFADARLGGWFPWTVRYPLSIAPGGEAAAWEAKDPPLTFDDQAATLSIDGVAPVFPPGGSLTGRYEVRLRDDHALCSAELSVLWYTAGAGIPELGVAYYEEHEAVDGDDLPLYTSREFRARLPSGPFSYDGTLFQVRWAVRLRLRYADGEEVVREIPFALGSSSSHAI
jgi:hypothetical protein